LQDSEARFYLEAEHAGGAAGRAQARRHGVDGAGQREQRHCRRPGAAARHQHQEQQLRAIGKPVSIGWTRREAGSTTMVRSHVVGS